MNREMLSQAVTDESRNGDLRYGLRNGPAVGCDAALDGVHIANEMNNTVVPLLVLYELYELMLRLATELTILTPIGITEKTRTMADRYQFLLRANARRVENAVIRFASKATFRKNIKS